MRQRRFRVCGLGGQSRRGKRARNQPRTGGSQQRSGELLRNEARTHSLEFVCGEGSWYRTGSLGHKIWRGKGLGDEPVTDRIQQGCDKRSGRAGSRRHLRGRGARRKSGGWKL